MWNDVVDLRDFYATSLGQVTRRLLRQEVRRIWPNLRGLNVLGIGYATPFLRQFNGEAERVIALMPAQQGVLRWPAEGASLVGLCAEGELPLPDVSIDRILLVHAVESSEQLRAMLRELWRVLADGGRMLIVVPNRRGIWARLDRTPYGHGHPYTLVQINRLLRDNMFTPMDARFALFMPPSRTRMMIASAPAIERIGRRWFPTFGGALVVEAGKQLYAGTAVEAPARTEPVVATRAARGSVGEAARSGGHGLRLISGTEERSPLPR